MLAIATAALLAFSATVEAATSKYDYGGREKYKHEYHGSYKPYYKHGAYEREHKYDSGHEAYKMRDYHYEPSYESHYAEDDYREPHYDSYDEGYGGDAYFEKPSYAYDYSPAKRYTRSVKDQMGVREGQFFGHGLGLGLGQLKKIGNSDARVHIHIFTGQGQGQAQDADQDQAQVADADSASQSDADSNAVLAAQLENENLAVDFL